jgi:DNA-binding SARP family transcriptional activator
VVSADRLVDAVWGDEVPGSATASLQAYISNLRKALRADTGAASPIVRQAPGYFLDISAADDVDLIAFTDHCVAARQAIAAQRCATSPPVPTSYARSAGRIGSPHCWRSGVVRRH